jgi:hypothetical protein
MAQSKRAGERAERSAALGAVRLGDAGEAACCCGSLYFTAAVAQ